ncbi:EF-hand domain-containing protein [Bradyrhizobium sp.]|uniref:EF-hand domain-containing protein n=1 Tax=Bradyrhizobium sp. TaxID=376 RepID=UPI0039E2905A
MFNHTKRTRLAIGILVIAVSSTACVSHSYAQMPPGGAQPPRPDPLADGPPIWDYDHDGTYTCDEWKRYMDQIFRFADQNHDGFLSASEFPAVRRAERTLAQADLGYFDDNRDGKVSRSEFVEKPSRFIGQYDKNADCKVTPAELKGTSSSPPGGGGRPGPGGHGGFGAKF